MLFILIACSQESGFSAVVQEEVFFQEGAGAVDILWVVDDSVSMQNEQEQVAAGFEDFIDALQGDAIDFHLGVVTTDMDLSNTGRGRLVGEPTVLTPEDDYVALFQERVLVGTDGSDKERGLQAALKALVSAEGFVREEAGLAVIFVSDENDCSDDNAYDDEAAGLRCYEEPDLRIPVQQYVEAFQELKGDRRLSVSSIIGPAVSEGCEDSWPGSRYESVSERLSGLIGNICDADYTALMAEIGERITDPERIFALQNPAVEESIEVEVDGELIAPDPEQGWSYEAEFYEVRFDGEWAPPFESTITIRYEIGS